MKVFFFALVAVVSLSASGSFSNSAQAADSWIFRPSYYTHDPATNVRIGRQYSRGPVYTRPQGEYINTGYKRTYATIQAGGRVFEQVNMIEAWVQGGAQF